MSLMMMAAACECGESFLYFIYMPAIDRSLSDCRWTRATLTDVTVDANVCTDSGGGVYIYEGAPLLTDCIILHNHALIDGGALYLESTLAVAIRFVIRDNVADGVAICIEIDEFCINNDNEFDEFCI